MSRHYITGLISAHSSETLDYGTGKATRSRKAFDVFGPLRATRGGHTQADPEDAKRWPAKEGEVLFVNTTLYIFV